MDPHPLARRSSMLAGRFKQNVSALAGMLRPDNVPVFSTRQTEQEALDWWGKHYHDTLGAARLGGMTPDAILALQVRLSQAREPQSPLEMG